LLFEIENLDVLAEPVAQLSPTIGRSVSVVAPRSTRHPAAIYPPIKSPTLR
jgi:hypothetical protein